MRISRASWGLSADIQWLAVAARGSVKVKFPCRWLILLFGEVAERLNAPVLKTGSPLRGS